MSKEQTFKEAFEEAMTSLTERFPDATILATATGKEAKGVSTCLHGKTDLLTLLIYNLMTSDNSSHMFMMAQMAGMKMGSGKITED